MSCSGVGDGADYDSYADDCRDGQLRRRPHARQRSSQRFVKYRITIDNLTVVFRLELYVSSVASRSDRSEVDERLSVDLLAGTGTKVGRRSDNAVDFRRRSWRSRRWRGARCRNISTTPATLDHPQRRSATRTTNQESSFVHSGRRREGHPLSIFVLDFRLCWN